MRFLGLLGEFGWDSKRRASELYANMIFNIAKAINTYEFNIAVAER